MPSSLPPEVWEHILGYAGPLALAADVGASRRWASAVRVQRTWRASRPGSLRLGQYVAVWLRGQTRRIGWVVGYYDGTGPVIRLLDRKCAFIYWPHPTARIRPLPRPPWHTS